MRFLSFLLPMKVPPCKMWPQAGFQRGHRPSLNGLRPFYGPPWRPATMPMLLGNPLMWYQLQHNLLLHNQKDLQGTAMGSTSRTWRIRRVLFIINTFSNGFSGSKRKNQLLIPLVGLAVTSKRTGERRSFLLQVSTLATRWIWQHNSIPQYQ